MGAMGQSLFSFYIYIENFKKSSCQASLGRFQYNLEGMLLLRPSTKFNQAIMIRQKNLC